MVSALRSEQMVENVRTAALMGLLALCFLWGGGSRLDIAGLAIVQPAAVLCCAIVLLVPGRIRWEVVRAPIFLLAGLATIMIVQLVPLPPDLWAAMPGRGQFAEGATLAGISPPWRPLTLTPDLTLASLIGLVVPLAVLVGFASLSQERSFSLLTFLLVATALSALLGLAQISAGPQNAFYRYEVTNHGVAVGFFSNRNHQALLLAMAFPILAFWAHMPGQDPRYRTLKRWLAAAMGVFLVPMLAVTGSRAGLVLGVLGLGFAWAHLRTLSRSEESRPRDWRAMLIKLAPIVAGVIVLVIAIRLSRAEAFDRLFETSFTDEGRVQTLPLLLRMVADFFPIGSGFGSFDQIYRFYEPFEQLRILYLNHAHNDLLELAITAGVPGLLIVLTFLIWLGRGAWVAFRSAPLSRTGGFGRLAVALLAIMLVSSMIDYPLRTPLLAALFAICCGWLGALKPSQR